MGNEFNKLLKDRKFLYKSLGSIYCPVIKNYIHFNARGFNHLRFRIDNTPRNPKEAMYKMGLIPLIPTVIKKANKFNYIKRKSPVGGSRKIILKEIEYWSLTGMAGKQNTKIKVVVRKIGDGKIHFWSVMKLS